MTMKIEKVYTSMSSAKRGAVRAHVVNPVYTTRPDGKIVLTEAVVKSTAARQVSASKVASPVQIFRAIFAANYGKVKRSELIAQAVEKGVGKNTAATYYQKLASAK